MDEIETNIIINKTGEVFSRKKFIDELFNDDGYLFWLKKRSARTFLDIDFPEELTAEEGWAFINIVKKMMTYKSNFISFSCNRKTRPADSFDIAKILNKSERQAYRYLKKYIKLRMIAKLDINIGDERICWYVVNPIYFMQEKRLSPSLYFLFKEDLDLYLKSWVSKAFEKTKNNYTVIEDISSEIEKITGEEIAGVLLNGFDNDNELENQKGERNGN